MVDRPGRGTPELTCSFTPDAPSVRAARHALASALTCDVSLARDVVLVASELMSNTLLHTEAGGRLDAWIAEDVIEIEVHDDDPNLPPWPPVAEGDARGLIIVDGIADDWGSRRTGAGKVVWARFLAVPRSP